MFDNESAHKQYETDREREKTDIDDHDCHRSPNDGCDCDKDQPEYEPEPDEAPAINKELLESLLNANNRITKPFYALYADSYTLEELTA